MDSRLVISWLKDQTSWWKVPARIKHITCRGSTCYWCGSLENTLGAEDQAANGVVLWGTHQVLEVHVATGVVLWGTHQVLEVHAATSMVLWGNTSGAEVKLLRVLFVGEHIRC